jgi:4a-hydroxytetrahydrobiopterin dehydratase
MNDSALSQNRSALYLLHLCRYNSGDEVKKMTEAEIIEQLQEMPEWRYAGNSIKRSFITANFRSAMAFVLEIAMLADTADHHPDIGISYNRVDITLATHSVGGISQRDFDLAVTIDASAAKYTEGPTSN